MTELDALPKDVLEYYSAVVAKEADERRIDKLLNEIDELVFWTITMARGTKQIQVHKKERK